MAINLEMIGRARNGCCARLSAAAHRQACAVFNAAPFFMRLVIAVLALLVLQSFIGTASANAQTRSLKLYYLHTGERAEIAYKRNGRYLPDGLKKINWFLRDWRRNEPTKIDPQLLDLVWEAYRQSGSRDYIHVISAYRSPASNEMLRQRGRGVAKNSQHTQGKALDFFLPDVKLSKLREIGLKLQVGGVGYYPKSGSPFVHLDTGSVRHWPRMTRQELVSVFPDGKTIHVPTDGKPLARYEQAVAEYNRRQASGSVIPESRPERDEQTLFQRLAARAREDQADDEADDAAPVPRAVVTASPPQPAEPVATVTAAAEPTPAADTAIEAEPEFAALPSIVPVPEMAPRDDRLDSGSQLAALTAAEETGRENAAAGVTGETGALQPAEDANEAEQTATDEDASTIVLAGIPLPSPRPDFEPASGTVAQITSEIAGTVEGTGEAGAPAELPVSSGELALAPSLGTDNETGLRMSALTPEEIEDLRRRAVARAAPAREPQIASQPSAPQPAAPIPAVVASPEERPSDILTASLARAGTDEEEPAPLLEAETAQAPGEADAPSEDGQIVTALLEAPQEERFVLPASIPVPTPRPADARFEVATSGAGSTAEIVGEIATAGNDASEPANGGIAQRTISLDEFSAPQENRSTIGQYALDAGRSIAELADVRAPAYGRSVLRDVSRSIILAGFDAPVFAPGPNGFSGRAVNRVNYASVAD